MVPSVMSSRTPWYRSRSRGRACRHARPRIGLAAILLAVAAFAAGCGADGSPSVSSDAGGASRLQVVAAENFWGSIAAQLGGAKADVQSIIVNPDTDPHSYEPTSQDARTLAGAKLAIVNGVGYDNWASKLLQADGQSGQDVLDVGDLLGL